MYPSSVVHTGVKFLGWEKRMAHPLPIHSWKLILPWVVSAVKFGASLLIRSAMAHLRFVGVGGSGNARPGTTAHERLQPNARSGRGEGGRLRRASLPGRESATLDPR